jgi:energy-coupling factor transporter ATP-binding protein EcfA2
MRVGGRAGFEKFFGMPSDHLQVVRRLFFPKRREKRGGKMHGDYKKFKEYQEFVDKLKSGDVKIQNYLTSNPFSKIDNEDIDGTMTERLFFAAFFVLSYKKYEHIARILNVAEDANRNTIFITGFRGCGKTTFVNYLKRMIRQKEKLPDLKKTDIDFLKDTELYRFFRELYSIFKQKIDCNEIEHGNNEQLREKCQDMDFLIKQINIYKSYINENISGKAIYLDFETDTSEYDSPVEQKLAVYLKERLTGIINEKINTPISDILCNIYKEFSDTTFEKKDNYYMKDFFDFIRDERFSKAVNSSAIRDNLNNVIKKLKTDQLLSLIVFVEWAYLEHFQKKEKIYFIFDNLDIIFDLSILNNFVKDYGSFLSNMAEFLREIKDKEGIFKIERSLHHDLCFIFIMRDTSQMQISDHFNDRLRGASIHFDISYDVNKREIISEKREFLAEIPISERQSAINNLQDNSELILKIIKDDANIKISSMFNFDYKRIINCLAYICDKYLEKVNEYIKLMEELESKKALIADGHSYQMYGVRGILYRIIFDHFKSQNYFLQLRIPEERTNQIHYSIARFILLYLNRIQFYPNDEFMVNDRGKVSLSTLFYDLKIIPPNTEAITIQELIEKALQGMYELRVKEDWGHLISFDTLKSTSFSDVLYRIRQNMARNEKDELVNIWITSAGRTYVRFMASHFEFYACRFCPNSNPLFCYENGNFNDKKNKYTFENVLEKVCDVMVNFCENMNLYVKKYKETVRYFDDDNGILKSNVFAYKNKDKDYSLFHEERYIHQHISYIDSYRMYLINKTHGRYKDKVIDINTRILKIIKRYIDLLGKYEYFSSISVNLYKEFSECYKYIVDTKNYDCNDVEISSPSYKNLIQRELVKG